MHECPFCGVSTISCRHCGWSWTPKDPENIPDICPRCRNDWKIPYKWNVKSKYGHGAIDPRLYKPKRMTDAEEYEISV